MTIKMDKNSYTSLGPSLIIKKKGEDNLFLNLEELRPGDLLLTKSSGLTAKAIARIISGHFSHAALVINQVALFESIEIGVGYALFKDCWLK